jgi:hypothetical protein
MPNYTIFGHFLRSEIVFPELRSVEDGTPRWTLRVSQRPRVLRSAQLLGKEDLGDGTEVRLYKFAGGYRLEYDDNTGAFDVSKDGGEIVWSSIPGAPEDLVRLHVIGRVLAAALHAAGLCCLHGSGVALNGTAIGFLAPRFWGKSTLAMALTRAGARLLSDDTLAVHPEDVPLQLWPGVHSVRLWGDSTARIAGEDPAAGASPFEVKRTFARLPQHLLACRPVPLSAIYLLAPHEGQENGPAVRRTPVAAVPAVLSLVGHAKIGALLGKSEAPLVFERAARVASRVPVYRLAFARDFERIGDVVAQLTEWHDGAADREARTP